MVKKYLSLFTLVLVLVSLSFILFHPQKTLGANDHVVISQVQTAGATTDDEFIELFNPTGSAIDLTGYRITKKVSSGTESNLVASMTGIIQPNKYYLVIPQGADYTGSVNGDTTYSGASFTIAGNNSILLYSDAQITLVDKLGFGSATDFEGTVFPTNPPANGSLQRINNQDTDSNSVDFAVLQTSNPRNSSIVVATSTPAPSVAPTNSPTATPVVTLQPTSTPTPTIAPTATPIATIIPTSTPTATPVQTISPTATPTPTATVSATTSPTMSPVATSLSTPTPKATRKPDRDHHDNDDYDFDLPFGFRCRIERRDFGFRNFHFKHYKLHFGRR